MSLKKGKLASFFGFKSQSQDKPVDWKPQPISSDQADLQEPSEFSSQPAATDDLVVMGATEDLSIKQSEAGKQSEPATDSVTDESDVKAVDDKPKITMEDLNMDHEYDDERLVINYSKEQLSACETKLDEFMRVCPGAYGVLISTIDGHELLYLLKRDIPVQKISTMNSSLLALGESIARESAQSFCQFVILENSDGRVVSLRINDILMLTCISSKDTNLGMLLSVGRNTASDLMQILQ